MLNLDLGRSHSIELPELVDSKDETDFLVRLNDNALLMPSFSFGGWCKPRVSDFVVDKMADACLLRFDKKSRTDSFR